MIRYWWVLLLLLPAAAADIEEVRLDHYVPMVFDVSDFMSACSSGQVEIIDEGRGFRFLEGEGTDGIGPIDGGGYAESGCGMMVKEIPRPAQADTMRLHFQADRTVDAGGIQAQAPIYQEVRLLDEEGGLLQAFTVFDADVGDRTLTTFQMEPFVVADRGVARIAWHFEDPGYQTGVDTPVVSNPASGQRFSAQVVDAVAHFPVPHAGSLIETTERRDGVRLSTETRVRVNVDEPEGRAIHVRADEGLELLAVVGPNGPLSDPETYTGQGLQGFAPQTVVLVLDGGSTEVTVPAALLAAEGAGEYVFIFEEAQGLQVTTPLLPVVAAMLVAPLPFALLAILETRAFRREAFGGYARSAAMLQLGVVLVFLYYVAVVASAIAGGRLTLMAVVPTPLEGVLLYIQVALAGVAFTILWRTARELYRIVRPKQSVRPADALDDPLEGL